MKISNNALNFLLAQYRAIFKRAYVKGLAAAVLMTAGLAAGQAQAAAPVYTDGLDNGNKYYLYSGSKWQESSGTTTSDSVIVAGQIGGNGLSGDNLDPEKALPVVSGGKLTIGGDKGQLGSVASGTVAGGWGQLSADDNGKGTITVSGNELSIVGSGSITKDNQTARGVAYGGYAQAASGTAIALNNKLFVDKGDSGSTPATSDGLIGGKALGVNATANYNEVHVSGTATDRQVLGLAGTFDVLGGFATTKEDNDNSGTYEASHNLVDLKYVKATDVGATGSGTTIAGARVAPDGTGKLSAVATGNKVDITALEIETAQGSNGINIFGAWSSKTLASGSVTMSQNSITLANSKLTKHESYTGDVSITAAAAQGNKSAQVSLTGNSVTLSDSVNRKDQPAVNTLYATKVIGARLQSTRSENDGKLQAKITGNSVDVQSGVVLTLADSEGFVAGADILVSGSKVESVNANNNSVTIAGDVTGSVYATRFESNNNDTLNTDATLSFLNNDVTLKAGATVQSGSITGGVGNDSAISIENGATYIANATTQDLASDVINLSGTIDVKADNTLDISGFYENGLKPTDDNGKYHDNLTTVASSAVIKNAGIINLFGKANVEQGATLTATGTGSKLVVDASKGLTDDDNLLLEEKDKVAGADQGTLAIFKDTLHSYLSADKVLSAQTEDSEGSVTLTSGGVLELRDTTNVDIATSFNFTKEDDVAGAIKVDPNADNSGSIIRGNELTVSHKLASNAVATHSGDSYATTYDGLSGATTAGIKLEANVLHLGSNTLQSWQSEELTFAEATFRDQLTFAAVNNGKKGTDDKNDEKDIVNDGYHLVSEVIGDHYKQVMAQAENDTDVPVSYYQAQDGVIEGDVTITKADTNSGTLSVRNGNYSADDSITIASGGTLSVGGGVDLNGDGTAETTFGNNEYSLNNAPDATLTLGQALTFDLSEGSGTVTVTGAQTDRYDAEAAAETLGDDRHVMLDLRQGITLTGDATSNDAIKGAAKLNVTSGGEILLTADTVNSLLAQNQKLGSTGAASGSFLTASSGGAFVVEGDIDATFTDFNGSGSSSNTHGITLSGGGFLVADSLTIDNAESVQDKVLDEDDGDFKFQSVDWGDGTVAVQDLEISDLQLTNGESKPAGANDYASYVTLAHGTAEIGSSLLSYNHTLKLGDVEDSTSGNLVFFAGDATAEGTITVDHIEVNQGFVAAYNGKWDGSNTNLTLSGAQTSLTVGDGSGQYADEDEEYSSSLTLNDITLTGDKTSVSVTEDGRLKAHKLSMAASSTLSVDAWGEAEFDQVDFSALGAASDATDLSKDAPVSVRGYLKINGDDAAVNADGTADAHNSVALSSADDSIRIFKNGTLEFGLAAVNGAILDTTSTTRFSGADLVKLVEGYGAITNQGGTLKLDFGSGTVFDEAAIKALKSKLFTAGSLDADGVLVQGGLLHINDATFEYLDGKLTQLSGAGLDGWTAAWSDVKEFSDIYGNDVGSNQTLQTNISGIKVDDQVKGNWGSLSMVANVSDKAQVTLVGHTTLNYASGNNGFFISDANRQTALGAKVEGNRTLRLVDGGEIGSISLHAANDDYEQETVLEVTSSAEGTGALTTIAEIKGYANGTASTNGVYGGTIANFRADTEVKGDIVGIDEVTAFTGTNVSVQNTTAVGELDTENANITVAQKAKFGTAYVFGGSITAQDAEMKAELDDSRNGDGAEIVVAHNGLFKVADTLTAHKGAAIRVGIDTSWHPEKDLTLEDGTVIGGTGYFEVGTLELNGGRLVVDPEYHARNT